MSCKTRKEAHLGQTHRHPLHESHGMPCACKRAQPTASSSSSTCMRCGHSAHSTHAPLLALLACAATGSS
eukprot:1155962-Pelagomonas_calceolata.AAC.4